MNILFVCKYNRFRSQIAEQFFRKYNKNKKIKLFSAGIFKGRYPLDKTEQELVKGFGIEINKIPETISIDTLMNTNLVVIVASDVPKNLFQYKGKYPQKMLKWNIKDENFGNRKNINTIIKNIELKVKDLIKSLEKKSK